MASQQEVDVLESWEDIEETDVSAPRPASHCEVSSHHLFPQVLEKSLNKLIATSAGYQAANPAK